MRTWLWVAFFAVGAAVTFLCLSVSSRLEQPEEKPGPGTRSKNPENGREEPRRSSGRIQPADANANNYQPRESDDEDALAAEEMLPQAKKPIELKLRNGRVNYAGAIAEMPDERYKGKRSFTVLSVQLDGGRTYQIDHTSRDLQAFLYLEDPDGNVLNENSSAYIGGLSRIVHRADKAGIYRIIATSLAGYRTGGFTCSIRVVNPAGVGKLPKGLPAWFHDLDTDGDGQIGLFEWREEGWDLAEFRHCDRNGDGFITPEEMRRHMKSPINLKLQNGRANYAGAIEEVEEATYKGKKSFKILQVQLEGGKTYQIDHASKDLQAFLHLEDADGNVLKEHSSPYIGGNSRIVYRAQRGGLHRIIATSLAGYRTGPFSCSIRVVNPAVAGLPQGLATWFEQLDKDDDGQIAFLEWRRSGKKLNDFHECDLNGDGFITPEEMLRHVKKPVELKLQNGRGHFAGTIEEMADERYQGKRAFRVLNILLEKGQAYQFDYVSSEFYAYLYLEDPDGNVVERNNSGGFGRNSRIIYRPRGTGIHRVIATSQDGVKSGAFTFSVRVVQGSAILTKNVPAWFKDLDKDEDGQVALQEWRSSGKKNLNDFGDYDLNGDGFFTAEEMLRVMNRPTELKLQNGQVHYAGVVEEKAEERYKGKKSFKVLNINLEGGRTFQIDHTSREFQAFLHLEDADGRPLMEHSSPTIGGNSRIVFRASKSGTYRIIATSLGGFRTGAFSFSVRVVSAASANLPQGLPPWFTVLDLDMDGQVGLYEWRMAGLNLNEFRKYDRNGDGLITPEEMLRQVKK
jgi:Ca2+-binding EF-hand superfamily protein